MVIQPKTINIPVDCVDEFCVTCPELDIEINSTIAYAYAYAVNPYPYIVNREIKCSHVDKCLLIKKHTMRTTENGSVEQNTKADNQEN